MLLLLLARIISVFTVYCYYQYVKCATTISCCNSFAPISVRGPAKFLDDPTLLCPQKVKCGVWYSVSDIVEIEAACVSRLSPPTP